MRLWFLANGYLPGLNIGKKFGVAVIGLDCNSVTARRKRDIVTGSGNNGELIFIGARNMRLIIDSTSQPRSCPVRHSIIKQLARGRVVFFYLLEM
jgi:hypothetical protein